MITVIIIILTTILAVSFNPIVRKQIGVEIAESIKTVFTIILIFCWFIFLVMLVNVPFGNAEMKRLDNEKKLLVQSETSKREIHKIDIKKIELERDIEVRKFYILL